VHVFWNLRPPLVKFVATSRTYSKTIALDASNDFKVDSVFVGHFPQIGHFQKYLAMDFNYVVSILNSTIPR
jgi:hypothetical protein